MRKKIILLSILVFTFTCLNNAYALSPWQENRDLQRLAQLAKRIHLQFLTRLIFGQRIDKFDYINLEGKEPTNSIDELMDRLKDNKVYVNLLKRLKRKEGLHLLHANLVIHKETGKGILIFGQGGAGKSSLSARMVGTKYRSNDYLYEDESSPWKLGGDDGVYAFFMNGTLYACRPLDYPPINIQGELVPFRLMYSEWEWNRQRFVTTFIEIQKQVAQVDLIVYLDGRNESPKGREAVIDYMDADGSIFGLGEVLRKKLKESDIPLLRVDSRPRDFEYMRDAIESMIEDPEIFGDFLYDRELEFFLRDHIFTAASI